MSAVTAVPYKAYKPAGWENFQHGAETYRKKTYSNDARQSRQDALNQNLLRTDMHNDKSGFCGTWTSGELKELWRLRYERKPKYTYDQLAKRFHKPNTWDIVNALCLLQNRKRTGVDMWTPINKPSCGDDPSRPVVLRRQPKPIAEKTKEIVRLLGEGYTPKEIGEKNGMTRKDVSSAISRVRKNHTKLFYELIEEGKARKK